MHINKRPESVQRKSQGEAKQSKQKGNHGALSRREGCDSAFYGGNELTRGRGGHLHLVHEQDASCYRLLAHEHATRQRSARSGLLRGRLASPGDTTPREARTQLAAPLRAGGGGATPRRTSHPPSATRDVLLAFSIIPA